MQSSKVVIYARVSSREQEREGFSIPAQLKLLREYAQKNGYEIVAEYSDAETAKKAGRTNYNIMLQFLRANPHIRTILVEKTDRLYRNFKDYVTLEDYDLEVHLVKEGSIISKNSKSHDKFIHGIKVLMAKNYIDNLSEEISKGLKEAVEEGYWPFIPPYGYKRGERKNLEIDPLQAIFIHKAFESFSTGKYSLRNLAQKLYDEGFIYTTKRPKITHSVLESMLKNVMYLGKLKCNGIIYQGNHPAIVSPSLFDKVQNAFRKVDKSRVRKHFDFLYPGIIKCETCGYAVCAEKQKKTNIYYRCNHYDKTCTNTVYLTEKEITFSLRWHLRRIALDQELYELVKQSLQESLKDEQEFHKSEVKRVNAEIEECTETLKKMYLDQLDGVLDRELWFTFKNEYELKLNRLNADLQRLRNANIDYMETGLKILDVCKKASMPASSLPPEKVAELLRETYQSVTLSENKKIRVVFKEPFATIENLIRTAKAGIDEVGYAEFRKNVISGHEHWAESIKKEPVGSIENRSFCTIWWALEDSNF